MTDLGLVVILIVISGLLVFSSKRKHLLSALLSLEYVSLGVFLGLISLLGGMDIFYSLIYITFTACEGALGLAVLVMMSRTHGGDYFKTFNIFSF